MAYQSSRSENIHLQVSEKLSQGSLACCSKAFMETSLFDRLLWGGGGHREQEQGEGKEKPG